MASAFAEEPEDAPPQQAREQRAGQDADLGLGLQRRIVEREVRSGVRGTPTLFLDSRPYQGDISVDALRAEFDPA